MSEGDVRLWCVNSAEKAAVESVLGERVLGWRELAGGYSHQTCGLDLASGQAVVRFGGASADVEAEVMRRAAAYVPVPDVRVVRKSNDEAVRSFMVIDHVAGVLLSDVLAADDADGGIADLGAAVAEVSLGIGAVAIASRPGFFADTELRVPPERAWSQQLPDVAAECMERTPDSRLDADVRRAWVDLCTTHAPALAEIDDLACLVHSDFNPKNILVRSTAHGWEVASVLDWEFAYAGCPAADAGNLLRHADDYPAGFVEGFRTTYGAGTSIADWEYLGTVIDMFALSELVTRPVGMYPADRAAGRIRALLDTGVGS